MPIILSGNKMAAQEAQHILETAGKYVVSVENVYPNGSFKRRTCVSAIREVFLQRIIQAKGIDKAQEFVGNAILPTPMAILKGAALLACGNGTEEGLGEIIVIDVVGLLQMCFRLLMGIHLFPVLY